MPIRWKIIISILILIGLIIFVLQLIFLIFYKDYMFFIIAVYFIEIIFILLILDIYYPPINILSKSIIKGKSKNKIALTFDDGPDPTITPKLLDLLSNKNIKATFFILGKNINDNDNVKIIERIKNEGHEIGSHGFSHKKVHRMKSFKFKEEILKTEYLLKKYIDVKPIYYRAPHGFIRFDLYLQLKKLGYNVAAWTLGVWDTDEDVTSEQIYKRAASKLSPGMILLLHDSVQNRKRPQEAMLEALEKIIDFTNQKGYKFVTLKELLKGEN